jgi:hypothetical protein
MSKALDWKRREFSVWSGSRVHSCISSVQICLSIDLYVRIFLLLGCLDFRPSTQNSLVSVIPSWFRFENICFVPGKSSAEDYEIKVATWVVQLYVIYWAPEIFFSQLDPLLCCCLLGTGDRAGRAVWSVNCSHPLRRLEPWVRIPLQPWRSLCVCSFVSPCVDFHGPRVSPRVPRSMYRTLPRAITCYCYLFVTCH